MNKEFLSGYRTAIIMLLTLVIAGGIIAIALKKENLDFLDRGLIFFSAMSAFILLRSLIRSIKIDNKALGIQVEASDEKTTQIRQTTEIKETEKK
jgi:uncharacterized membrane protein